eukprot:gene9781-11588_t
MQQVAAWARALLALSPPATGAPLVLAGGAPDASGAAVGGLSTDEIAKIAAAAATAVADLKGDVGILFAGASGTGGAPAAPAVSPMAKELENALRDSVVTKENWTVDMRQQECSKLVQEATTLRRDLMSELGARLLALPSAGAASAAAGNEEQAGGLGPVHHGQGSGQA